VPCQEVEQSVFEYYVMLVDNAPESPPTQKQKKLENHTPTWTQCCDETGSRVARAIPVTFEETQAESELNLTSARNLGMLRNYGTNSLTKIWSRSPSNQAIMKKGPVAVIVAQSCSPLFVVINSGLVQLPPFFL
jgi:hypothetical protein